MRIEELRIDRFGPLPEPLKQLFRVTGLKLKMQALGVLKLTTAQVALANTGVAGPDAAPDGTTPGTVCFAWGFRLPEHTQVYSETVVFSGSRNRVRRGSVKYALQRAMAYHAMVFGPQSSFQPPPPRARVT